MKTRDISILDPKSFILIKGAQLHNLKNIDVAIPRNRLVVITGLSGSGKSTLAFDTLYAEGQRRYVESLSSYARQFLGRLDKPKVDYIKGISPAIAIEQKVNTTNARSTVGTSTEIYDYLKLLFARIGRTISPISGQEVQKHSVSDVLQAVQTFAEGSKLLLLAPIHWVAERGLEERLQLFLQQGYARIYVHGQTLRIDEVLEQKSWEFFTESPELVIDRVVVETDEAFMNRLADAIQTAFFEGKGQCHLLDLSNQHRHAFSNRFEQDGQTFIEPTVHLFSFNNPYGACPTCEGYGNVIGIDEDLVVPNTALSIYDNAIYPWRGESMKWYNEQLVNAAFKFDFPIHKPYYQLTDDQKALIWTGNKYFMGLHDFFRELEDKNYKIQNRVLLSRYRGKTKCSTCKGKRLRPEASYVQVGSKTLPELVDWPLHHLSAFFNELSLTAYEQQVAKRLLVEITNRLQFLADVGLSYLNLNRNSASLSGGESQRINLATSLGSSLVGSLYILDEPSIGLHPKDTDRLIHVLKKLKEAGNTVIVVEHDEDIMKAADYLFDIGPEAGRLGGELVAEGNWDELIKEDTLTAGYLNGTLRIEVPAKRRPWKNHLTVVGAREHNLKNIDVTFPLDVLTVITGVSGSGKSTLVKRILYPVLQKQLVGVSDKAGQFTSVEGSYAHLKKIEYIDQNPIGRSSRSNPVTYIKAYDDIRELFSKEKLSKIRGFQPKHFSFNVDGGRCETCSGEGSINVEMVFMADVTLPCEACQGKRFKKEVLEVLVGGQSIDDVLNMTVAEALDFFAAEKQPKIVQKLQPLQDVGLDYVQLGQSSSTLSGGEAQRIKLASFLVKGATKDKTLFVFDEPSTGLHFHDIKKLLKSLDALIELGHSVIVIEHNLDVIKCADWIIDLGPEGGENGGYCVGVGTPETLINIESSITGVYLKEKL